MIIPDRIDGLYGPYNFLVVDITSHYEMRRVFAAINPQLQRLQDWGKSCLRVISHYNCVILQLQQP